jgi:hypothetical protein
LKERAKVIIGSALDLRSRSGPLFGRRIGY